MGVEVTEVSLRLDELLLQFMDQLELLEDRKRTLNSLIEEGWFAISKARYAMGNKSVSALQYGSEMEPLVHVHHRALETGEVAFRTERKELQPPGGFPEEIGPKEEGMRRRKTNKPKDPTEEPQEPQEASLLKDVSRQVGGQPQPQDPLKWFGILVPQSLKQAQSNFKRVIELSAEVAALQTRLMATRREMQRSLQEKRELLTGKEEQ